MLSGVSGASGTAQILLVNDEPEALACTRNLLEGAHYHVETSSNREDAIERIENGLRADLIFLCMDPAEDDFKTIQSCRRIRPEQKLVVISPVNDVSTVVKAIRMGALDYISHPMEETEFLAIAQRFLALHQWIWHGGSGTASPRTF